MSPEVQPPPHVRKVAAQFREEDQRGLQYVRYEGAFQSLTPPFAFVDLEAMQRNGERMLAQANGKPIRVASKSIRSVALLRRALDSDAGFRGVLAFTLPEALYLHEQGFEDIVVAYPTVDRRAIGELARVTAEHPDTAPVLMIDNYDQLDLLENAIGAGRAAVRVAIDVDVGWWPMRGRLAKIGPKRSIVRQPWKALKITDSIESRPGTRLVGMMFYEGHIAGVGDIVPGNPLRSLAIRAMQALSAREIRKRRAKIVAAVSEALAGREGGGLEFVNGGGTGSLSRTSREEAVTELTAGSGFYCPALFDNYRSLDLEPAAFFCLPIVRKPSEKIVTALGGGYVASGAASKDRLPVPWLPPGLRLDKQEGAGEVQTPLLGEIAQALRAGDRVYLRHAKAGELCERFDSLYLLEGERIVDEVPTYRGEGHAFL